MSLSLFFTACKKTYTVTWQNHDGTILDVSEKLKEGSLPTYYGATPTKDAEEGCTYTFSGWSPEIVEVTEDCTYTAEFTKILNEHVVTWRNHDGTVLERDENVQYGTMPSFDGPTPTKPGDAEFTYVFSGWSPKISKVEGDVSYRAQFLKIPNKYTITWKNYDGAVLKRDTNILYGETPSYNGPIPTKPKDAQYTYTFDGWSPAISGVTGDVIYTAQFTRELNKYKVTWKNWNGEDLRINNNVPYGTMPTYNGATPEKTADAQYAYSFSGWGPEVSEVTGDIVYTATFNSVLRTYSIMWQNWNNDILETDNGVPYGTMPSYDGIRPTKPQDAQYTYTFSGWSPVVTRVTGYQTYVAQFSRTLRQYQVTWANWNGEVLETDLNVEYGATPIYNGTTPTRPEDSQYICTFDKWSPEVSTVTGNITYTAQYTRVENKHKVTWKNWNGEVLETDIDVPTGTMPSYDGLPPTRPKDAQYTYSFIGWYPEVSAVTKSIEYTAQYSTTTNEYTVTWKNWDNDVLETDLNVPYGTMPSFDKPEPSRTGNAQYTYTFNGWNPTVSQVTGNVEYKAQFIETVNTYTVTWKDWNEDVLETDLDVPYGNPPSFDKPEPTRTMTAQYEYTFKGWATTLGGDVVSPLPQVTGETIYYAVFTQTLRKYTVTWKNYNDDVLETDQNVEYGTFPSYDGLTPTKPMEGEYYFAFDGWLPEVVNVVGNAEYTAKFLKVQNTHTVKWANWNGTILETDSDVATGVVPTYDGLPPTRPKDAQYTYTFIGWLPAVKAFEYDVTYVAQYSLEVNKYTVTWKNWDDDVLETDLDVPYGEMPSFDKPEPARAGDAQYTYTFNGWNPTVSEVTGNVEYKAQFIETVNTYTVTWKDWDGTELEVDLNVPYGNPPSFDKPNPTKEMTAQYEYIFAGWATSQGGAVVSPLPQVSGETVYWAIFTETQRKYTVTWKNYDGSDLEVDNDVLYEGTPSYDQAEDPVKPMTVQYVYTFAGWAATQDGTVISPLPKVTENVTYFAVFTQSTRTYEVTWQNPNGDVLYKDDAAPYGTTPSYGGSAPSQADSTYVRYYYTGWDKPVEMVQGNQVYTATYASSIFKLSGGNSWAVDGLVNNDYSGNVEVPGEFLGKAVTAINNNAFAGANNVTYLSIPSSVTYIGAQAFAGMVQLQTLIVPFVGSSLNATSGSGLFGHFFGKTSLTGTTATDQKYGSDPSNISTAYIPNSLTTVYVSAGNISYGAFNNCGNITQINLGNPQTISQYAFDHCTSLATVNLGNVLQRIESNAFSYSGIVSITIPNSVTQIDSYAFSYCASLTTFVANNADGLLTTVATNIFAGCNVLASLAIPVDVSFIGALFSDVEVEGAWNINGYWMSPNLETMTVTGGTLVEGVFADTSINNLTITNKITSINVGALTRMIFLVDLSIPYVGTIKEPTELVPEAVFGAIFGATSYTNSTKVNQRYKSGYTVTYYIPTHLKYVTVTGGDTPYGAFSNIETLTLITISNATTIGSYSFSQCTAAVSLNNEVTTIKSHAFYYNKAGGSFVAPSSIITIEKNAFYYSEFTSISIGSTIETIGDDAFQNCKKLTTLTIDSYKVYIVPSYMCDGCILLESIVIPKRVTEIKTYAFRGCSALASVTIPVTVNTIGSYAFASNTTITQINYEGTMAQWELISKKSSWMNGCTNLTTVVCTDGNVSLV